MAGAAASGLVLSAVGALAISGVGTFHLSPRSLFYAQFARIEGPALCILAVFCLATLALLRFAAHSTTSEDEWHQLGGVGLRARSLFVATAAAAIVLIGTNVVFKNFFLSDDEYSAWFQAVIFAKGKWSAVVAPEWCRWIDALTPSSIGVWNGCTWHLSFLPLHSAVRAAFMALHAEWLAGPLTAGLSVLLLAALCRRVWPLHPRRAWIAVLVFATSSQFLAMAMTMYAMPTHLLFALVWLWLYVVDSRWSLAVLPWVGAISLGVHSPFPHLLLAAPFIFRYLRNRRFAVAAYCCAVYVVGLMYWRSALSNPLLLLGGDSVPGSASRAVTSSLRLVHLASPLDLFTSAMNLVLTATWAMPLAGIGVLAAALSWKRLDAFTRDSLLGLALIFVGRTFLHPLQGEGWGFRYVHANLGNLAMASAVGIEVVGMAVGWDRARWLLGSALGVALIVELPLRGVQIREVVGPYYRTYQYLHSQPGTVVVFPASDVQWGRQLVRNDPFLITRPLLMEMPVTKGMTPPDCSRLSVDPAVRSAAQICAAVRHAFENPPESAVEAAYPGQVTVISVADLERLGIPPAPFARGMRLRQRSP